MVAGKRMTLRPGLVRLWSVMVPLAFLIAVFAVPLSFQSAAAMPRDALESLVSIAVICAMGWLAGLTIRLVVTETTVEARLGRRYGNDQRALRSEIRAIHYFPRLISFRGPDDEPIMMLRPLWTRRQMLKVARELNVPLYNHMRWLGLKDVQEGRLEYDPRAARPPADAARHQRPG